MNAAPDPLFESLRKWVENHLEALSDEAWQVDEDDGGVLASLRCIVTGELGCTERSDYGDDQWAVLMAVQAGRAASVAEAAMSHESPFAPGG